jgi:hypothetical protein
MNKSFSCSGYFIVFADNKKGFIENVKVSAPQHHHNFESSIKKKV